MSFVGEKTASSPQSRVTQENASRYAKTSRRTSAPCASSLLWRVRRHPSVAEQQLPAATPQNLAALDAAFELAAYNAEFATAEKRKTLLTTKNVSTDTVVPRTMNPCPLVKAEVCVLLTWK